MNDATTPDRNAAPGLELGNGAGASYRVLARKYRPASFDDLIGQDAMVRTVSNAFETGRIPQAWILTGVRGVGKTTTARILARALNYELPDGSVKGPTIHMPVLGIHDQSIMESRHIDVIEMDAASHNGVDDVRQINDAVRYAPVQARYKVYILDEVHMLSTAAFNALLKTLEEPPPHAKFIFATTEIRKVPVTVLSRCQRFDLRRVEGSVLVKHLEGIAKKEGIETEPEALALIARAAEGSVRDSLSLLDQAIAHAAGSVRAEDIRNMLGLADRTRVIGLFEALMKGDVATALAELRDQYDSGADPSVVLSDLAEFTHFVTRVKVVPAVTDDVALTEAERTRGRTLATALSTRVLSRTWQMLLKGIGEVQAAGKPIAAAEMVLVRIAYAADLPTPDEVIRSLDANGDGGGGSGARAPGGNGNGGGARAVSTGAMTVGAPATVPTAQRFGGGARAALASVPQSSVSPAPQSAPQPAQALPTQALPTLVIDTFEQLVTLASEKRDIQMKMALQRDVRLVRCEDGKLEIALEQSAQRTLVNDLSRKLQQWTGRPWVVIISREQGAPTLKAVAEAKQAELEVGVQSDPLVRAVLDKFPGAQIVRVRGQGDAAAPPPAAMEALPPAEEDTGDDDVLSEDAGFGENWVRDDGGE